MLLIKVKCAKGIAVLADDLNGARYPSLLPRQPGVSVAVGAETVQVGAAPSPSETVAAAPSPSPGRGRRA